MKCKFRTWGTLNSRGDEILHNWYCKVHKVGGRFTDRELAAKEQKAHKKEMKKR
jgi:hypothetical protein